MDMKIIKTIGYAATILSIGTSLVSDWVGEKKQDQAIDEKVDKALAERFKKDEES